MIFFDRISISMTAKGDHDITGMLAAWNDGSAEALDRVIAVIYPELRRIARKHLARRKPGESLESVALANEAYLKLLQSGGIRCENRTHFLALCSQMIRRILIDHARSRGFAKRGGSVQRLPLDQVLVSAQARGIEVLALDEALKTLARIDARKSRVVERSEERRGGKASRGEGRECTDGCSDGER